MTATQGSSFGGINRERWKGELWNVGHCPLGHRLRGGGQSEEGGHGSWGLVELGGPHVDQAVFVLHSHHEDSEKFFSSPYQLAHSVFWTNIHPFVQSNPPHKKTLNLALACVVPLVGHRPIHQGVSIQFLVRAHGRGHARVEHCGSDLASMFLTPFFFISK